MIAIYVLMGNQSTRNLYYSLVAKDLKLQFRVDLHLPYNTLWNAFLAQLLAYGYATV